MGNMIQFEIRRTLAELSCYGDWHKLLTFTAWGRGEPKLDLRSWKQDGDRVLPGRGVTLTVEEARVLRDALDIALVRYAGERRDGGQYDA